MVPKRATELVKGGSLYWVVKGRIACRQRLLAVRPFTDGEGIGRCHLVLEPVVHPVESRPCRPFQGWRYLPAKAAPRDLSRTARRGGDAGDPAARAGRSRLALTAEVDRANHLQRQPGMMR